MRHFSQVATCLWLAAAIGTVPVAAQPARETVAELFARIDKNHDGRLSREETTLLPAIAEQFATLDKDNDGFLTLDEFAAGVRPDGRSLALFRADATAVTP